MFVKKFVKNRGSAEHRTELFGPKMAELFGQKERSFEHYQRILEQKLKFCQTEKGASKAFWRKVLMQFSTFILATWKNSVRLNNPSPPYVFWSDFYHSAFAFFPGARLPEISLSASYLQDHGSVYLLLATIKMYISGWSAFVFTRIQLYVSENYV